MYDAFPPICHVTCRRTDALGWSNGVSRSILRSIFIFITSLSLEASRQDLAVKLNMSLLGFRKKNIQIPTFVSQNSLDVDSGISGDSDTDSLSADDYEGKLLAVMR